MMRRERYVKTTEHIATVLCSSGSSGAMEMLRFAQHRRAAAPANAAVVDHDCWESRVFTLNEHGLHLALRDQLLHGFVGRTFNEPFRRIKCFWQQRKVAAVFKK